MKKYFLVVLIVLVAALCGWKINRLYVGYLEMSTSEVRRFEEIARNIKDGSNRYSNDQIADLLKLVSNNQVSEYYIKTQNSFLVVLSVLFVLGIPISYWLGYRSAKIKNGVA